MLPTTIAVHFSVVFLVMQIDVRVHHRLGVECRSERAAAHSRHAQLGILHGLYCV
jgi:hypothetical protein